MKAKVKKLTPSVAMIEYYCNKQKFNINPLSLAHIPVFLHS